MAMNKSAPGRTAAILTTAEVSGTTFSIDKAARAEFSLDFTFTIGSLTNVVLRFYASMDGTNWDVVSDIAGNVSYTVTASVDRAFPFKVPGYTNFKASVQGTGTVTSSSAAFAHRYRDLGAW
jgi:hypothetical protein